jgi:hypothetical protein
MKNIDGLWREKKRVVKEETKVMENIDPTWLSW